MGKRDYIWASVGAVFALETGLGKREFVRCLLGRFVLLPSLLVGLSQRNAPLLVEALSHMRVNNE